jgi:hypothetical protein
VTGALIVTVGAAHLSGAQDPSSQMALDGLRRALLAAVT